MRWIPPLLLVIVAVALGLHHRGPSSSPPPERSGPSAETQAARALTLLDVWSHTLVPDILEQQAWRRAVRNGNAVRALDLHRRMRRDLLRVRRFDADVAQDPVLMGGNRAETAAVRATATAWREWASALLNTGAAAAGYHRRLADALEAKAIRLHDAAYTLVDRSLRSALRIR